MLYIGLPDTVIRPLPFYLAMEEFVAKNIDEEECFFMWQVNPTVIFGRNQLIENEVNMKYCQEHHIDTYRRKSGGGCVYADRSNVMFSYITKNENVNFTFNKYINRIILMLMKMGVDAHASGRNDLMIGERKVSGNAFYHIPGRSIVHGTMLYDTNMKNMVGAITPSENKLVSKGIQSVRQYIALLKDYTSLSLEEFKTFAKQELCKREVCLTTNDIRKIEEIMQEYMTDDFIYGKNPCYTLCRKQRIEGVGDFDIRMEIKNDTIRRINIMGDFLLAGDLDEIILKPLYGCRFNSKSIDAVLPENTDNIIVNLKKQMLIAIICGNDE